MSCVSMVHSFCVFEIPISINKVLPTLSNFIEVTIFHTNIIKGKRM